MLLVKESRLLIAFLIVSMLSIGIGFLAGYLSLQRKKTNESAQIDTNYYKRLIEDDPNMTATRDFLNKNIDLENIKKHLK
jgi:hypothetical protein